tara:strand:+ start:436 stop:1131 length:696 start_codon:yes stop_codon:yes gene_type:complete
MKGIFLPSMIEVEFGEYYKKCSKSLYEKSFNSFHIDFGDNELIGRELNPWDKVNFLKSLGPDIKLTSHIMCSSGRHILSVENIAERCLKEGFEIIYIHPRSFKDLNKLIRFKENLFQNNHNIFGIVSELERKENKSLIEFIKGNSIYHLLQMAVPIGKGGQNFCWNATDRIIEFNKYCSSLVNIEIDGGLTFNVLNKLKNYSINRFAGWSIIQDSDPSIVLSKALKINQNI